MGRVPQYIENAKRYLCGECRYWKPDTPKDLWEVVPRTELEGVLCKVRPGKCTLQNGKFAEREQFCTIPSRRYRREQKDIERERIAKAEARAKAEAEAREKARIENQELTEAKT